MVEKSKKRKKGFISEQDISTLLQRYSVKTVLTLLHEVAKMSGKKIDWNAVVKNNDIGISSAKECQMLWRHLAYGQTLMDQFDNATYPMDDDSDLEYELEAFPAVSREDSRMAVACVKVLLASDNPNDSGPPNPTIEAPLIINIPSCKTFNAPPDRAALASAMQGTNICIPVSVPTQPLSSRACGEKRPNSATSGARKRRCWTTEEDTKLTAAVQIYGERNWANFAREDFSDREASELSQRWANLRRKQGNSNAGTSSKHSEAELTAARRALSTALDMPLGDNLKAARQMSTIVGTETQSQSQTSLASEPHQQSATAGILRSQMPTRWPPIKPTTAPDPIKAAALAAGARMATSADVSSLIEATRSQNVVRITPGGSSSVKSSTTNPSNVHYIPSGSSKAPTSLYSTTLPYTSRPSEALKAPGSSTKPAVLVFKSDPVDWDPMEPSSEDQSAPPGNQSKES